MNSRWWTSVGFGGVLAGVVWASFPGLSGSDQTEVSVAMERPVVVRGVRMNEGRIFGELDRADSLEGKLTALEGLQALDLRALKLEMAKCPERAFVGELSFAVKAMLLRLAEIDPEEGMAFVSALWMDDLDDDNHGYELAQAWPLVAAEWADQDPLGLLGFWERTKKTLNHSLRISPQDMSELLLAGRPLGFMTFYHTNGHLFETERFVSTLRSGKDFREALGTWRNSGDREEKRRSDPRVNNLAQQIIARWRELDEDAFLSSEFVGWEKGA